MALTPDSVKKVKIGTHTLTINEKIIPDNAVAPKDVNLDYCRKGMPMKPCRNFSYGCMGITVHNSNEISIPSGGSMAEQYTRATWPNGNMSGVIVHFYVWKSDIWQNLKLTEQGWHAADGSSRRMGHNGHLIGGNLDTIAIEVIGNDDETNETAAKLCAYLCKELHLDPRVDIYTHNYWMYGKDQMITNRTVRKNCPVYIFSKPTWPKFVEMCASYYGSTNVSTVTTTTNTTLNDSDTRKKTSGYVDMSKNVASRRIQYNLNYHGEYYLSEHFQVKEFACKDGRSSIIIDDRLVYLLELIFKKLDCTKMIINSGYRPADYEKSIGLSGVGQHVLGKAADITCYNKNGIIPAKNVVCAAEDVGGIYGIGYISATAVHIDSRLESQKWWGDETVSGEPSIWRIKPNCTSWYDYFGLTNPNKCKDTPIKNDTDKTTEDKKGYVVQVGAYSSMKPVGEILNKVVNAGYYGKTLIERSGNVYKAQVGFFKTKDEALKCKEVLSSKGITNSFIKYYT